MEEERKETIALFTLLEISIDVIIFTRFFLAYKNTRFLLRHMIVYDLSEGFCNFIMTDLIN